MNLQEQINRIHKMMGIIKESESNHFVDRILDKVKIYGKDKLTQYDKDFMKNPDDEKLNELYEDREQLIYGTFDYDPRTPEETEFWSDASKSSGVEFNFSDWSDEDIRDGSFDIIYNEIDPKFIYEFIHCENVPEQEIKERIGFKSWDQLSKETKDKFAKFIDNLYF